MALRFVDSFDHYDDNQIADKYGAQSGVLGSALLITGGKHGNGIQHTGTLESHTIILDAQAEWYVGFWWSGRMVTNNRLVGFLDGATRHMELMPFGGSGTPVTLAAFRNATQVATASLRGTREGVWTWFEVYCKIADSGGRFKVIQNGEVIIDFTGDTRNGGNASADRLIFGGINAGVGSGNWDDLYICDASGSAPNNTFLGEVRVEALFPTGNGNSSVLVGSDGNSTNNYLLVDETTSPDSADYVESSTPGDKDTYAFGDPTPASGTVFGVQINPWAAKTDAGVRSIVSVARLSGTETDGPVKTLLQNDQVYVYDVRATKPGGGAWSLSDVSNAEFGAKINA
jgi:hypothetical protein